MYLGKLRTFANAVGFVGLGAMGGPMTANLVKNGYSVKAFDLSAEAVDAAVKTGASKAETIEEASTDVQAIVTMLPNTQIVESVSNTVSKVAKPGTLLIDSSTIHPSGSFKIAAAMQKANIGMVDAPVSGGVMGAQNGTLTFMCGGSQQNFDEAKPYLEAMGKNIFYCGDNGAGLAVKIVNNFTLAAIMITTCEGLALGEKLGLDLKVLTEVMSVSTGRSWPLDTANPAPGVLPNAPSTNHYKGGFATDLMLKDLGIAIESAEEVGQQIKMGKTAGDFFAQAHDAGLGGEDFAAVYKLIKDNLIK